ncbi:MAG: hypothetical protein ACI825_000857 [Planctomycetota bacterium]|jgi:hypothetical protein|uniref:DUF6452 family protein n=1 Tax=Patiriisocius sp. Uisw_047 TaxID=3230969 RepID=UPI0039E94080
MKFLKLWPHLALALVIFITGCTRDDICDPGEATTPLLIITFKDFLNRDEAKQVVGLSVIGDYTPEVTILTSATTDSIAIPMRTAADNTQYQLIRAATDTSAEIIDVYLAAYAREDVYINRACSYKTIFNNVAFSKNTTDSDNDPATWILDVVINQTNVTDENQSHITIYH